MQSEEVSRHFAKLYAATLEGRDVDHDPVLLIFSGPPGSGKTTLAKKLTRDLHAQYIRHDAIRDMIRKEGMDPSSMDMAAISRIVLDAIFQQDKNRFIIIDASLDRTWEVFFDYAKKVQAKPIVIRLNVGKEVFRERIRARKNIDSDMVEEYVDRFVSQFNNCKRHVKADIELHTDYDYSEVLNQVKNLR